MNQFLLYSLLGINIFAYLVMCTDKLKSIYKWWRISEKTLWIFAILGGVFGIWLGMTWPMYHKAGKQNFKTWIPVIAIIWIIINIIILTDYNI